jgi:hypothetical protein
MCVCVCVCVCVCRNMKKCDNLWNNCEFVGHIQNNEIHMYIYIHTQTQTLTHIYICVCVCLCFILVSKGRYTLSDKLSDFTVWCHTWRKNWVNCAVLTGNRAGLRTVLSSHISHTALRNSLRESHSLVFIHHSHTNKKTHRTDKKKTDKPDGKPVLCQRAFSSVFRAVLFYTVKLTSYSLTYSVWSPVYQQLARNDTTVPILVHFSVFPATVQTIACSIYLELSRKTIKLVELWELWMRQNSEFRQRSQIWHTLLIKS